MGLARAMTELRLRRMRDQQKRRARAVSAAKLRTTARVSLIVAVSGLMVVGALHLIGVI
jgi:hypothetical protein